MHRFVGRGVFAAVNVHVHALGYCERFRVSGHSNTKLSLQMTSFHYDGCKPWAYGRAITYLIDLCLRATKTRLTTATVRPLRDLGATRVEIPGINSGWRAGQHVRLRMISSGMGLVLFCKKAGSWTNKVFDIASSGIGMDSDEKSFCDGRGSLRVRGSGNRMIASFSAALFVAGGSGISLATLRKQSRVKFVELIWTVQDPSSVIPMIPLLTAILQDSVLAPISVHIFVSYTRAPTGAFPFVEDFFRSPCLTVSPGRPMLILILHTIECTNQEARSAKINDMETPSGLFVGVCGPMSLAESVCAAIGGVDP
ncbi:hypothetical protein GGU11DRAFT_818652 [Lentinula aff. detonsa]|nr:hypothetical protein GGU11DRAFT_818652 [Lentinula aff. detonsa]